MTFANCQNIPRLVCGQPVLNPTVGGFSKVRKNLTYLLLFAIVMAFSGLLSAYLVSKGSVDFWVSIRIPTAFYWSTAFILLSSVTVQLALVVTRQGRTRLAAPLLLASLALGLAFAFSQFKGWKELRSLGNILSFSKVLQSNGLYGQDYTIARKGITLALVNGQYFMPDDTEHSKPLMKSNQFGEASYGEPASP